VEALIVIFVVGLLLLPIAGVTSSSGAGMGASSTSSANSGKKETVIIQQSPPQQSGGAQSHSVPRTQSAAKSFAVKSYSKINADNKNGGGEYLNSLVTIMESEGIPKEDALVIIKQALRKANGNAEIFGEQIEKFME